MENEEDKVLGGAAEAVLPQKDAIAVAREISENVRMSFRKESRARQILPFREVEGDGYDTGRV